MVLVNGGRQCLEEKEIVFTIDLLPQFVPLREEGSATRAVVANRLHERRINAEAIMEMANPESVKKAVQSGLGKIVSSFAVETELQAMTLVAIKIKGHPESS
jgi:hypothetical protein